MSEPIKPWEARFRGFRVLDVLRVADVTPRMRRVTLGGPELEAFGDGPNVKILVPPAGVAEPQWPMRGADGGAVWPPDPLRPTVRTYTLRRNDPQAREIDIDFVLHDHGVAARWAAAATPGHSRLGVGLPGGLSVRDADWYLIAGDESALPAIGRILERLPRDARGQALIEIANAEERQPLPTPDGVAVTWLDRRGAEAGTTDLLEQAVRGIDVPSTGTRFAWAAGESSAICTIRKHWRASYGLDHRSSLAFGYWKRGLHENAYARAHNHDRDDDYDRAYAEQDRSSA